MKLGPTAIAHTFDSMGTLLEGSHPQLIRRLLRHQPRPAVAPHIIQKHSHSKHHVHKRTGARNHHIHPKHFVVNPSRHQRPQTTDPARNQRPHPRVNYDPIYHSPIIRLATHPSPTSLTPHKYPHLTRTAPHHTSGRVARREGDIREIATLGNGFKIGFDLTSESKRISVSAIFDLSKFISKFTPPHISE